MQLDFSLGFIPRLSSLTGQHGYDLTSCYQLLARAVIGVDCILYFFCLVGCFAFWWCFLCVVVVVVVFVLFCFLILVN